MAAAGPCTLAAQVLHRLVFAKPSVGTIHFFLLPRPHVHLRCLLPPPFLSFIYLIFTLLRAGLGGPKQATSLVEQCAAFIARDFEFCLRAKLVLPEHLYLRVLHHTFTSKLPSS